MKLRPRCARCKKAASDTQASFRDPAGARILLVHLRPARSEDEIEALHVFQGALEHVLRLNPLEDIARGYVVRCPHDPVRVAYVRNCEPELTALLSRRWCCVIAGGLDVLRYALLRGSAPPSMNVMLGRPVRIREYGGQTVFTIPAPEELLLTTGNANDKWYRPEVELMQRRKAMEAGLLAVRRFLGE